MDTRITIPGKPIAKHRPRFYRRGNYVGTYNDQQTEEGRWQLFAAGQVKQILDGPIKLEVMFYMPIPKSAPKRNRPIWHTKKPDLDNLIKFVKDCLNGIAWKDDSQVCSIAAEKMYNDEPQTVICIHEMPV